MQLFQRQKQQSRMQAWDQADGTVGDGPPKGQSKDWEDPEASKVS